MLETVANETARAIAAALDGPAPSLVVQEIGSVAEVGGGIARVKGLPGVAADELVAFGDGLLGIATDLEVDSVGVVLLGHAERLLAGAEVHRTGRVVDAPVGASLLGRVVDATGRALDERGPIVAAERRPIETEAPAIIDRSPVTVPLQTGIKSVDALVPVGRGQRELIIGDRQTGKTALAVDAMINQRGTDVVCIYCAIGQRGTAVARVVDALRQHDVLRQCVVVVAAGEDPPGLQFITPYAATAMAEHFMLQGRDVLLVYDDLTRHARAYRELSLLLRRPPGREAYPGDVFYLHSRLLERATHLTEPRGGGSLTALPIIETQAQDIAAYIPTNLISITDGQIYLSPDLFRKGVMPAVDVGKSVSRVGGKTQLAPLRGVAGDLRLAYAQFEELESFSRFATRLDDATRATIERGRRVREILKQPERQPLSVAEQVAILHALNRGLFDALPLDAVAAAEATVRAGIVERLAPLCRRIDAGAVLDDADWQALYETAQQLLGKDVSDGESGTAR
jgi:F-type H+/Na+-transporting ATPase subunit alpha